MVQRQAPNPSARLWTELRAVEASPPDRAGARLPGKARAWAATLMLHEETGEIVKVMPDKALVKVLATSACGNCATACGMTEDGHRLVEVLDPIGVQPRQEVGLQLPGQALVGAAFVMYGVPVLLLLLGLGLGSALAHRYNLPPDGVGAAAALGAMGLGFAALYRARGYFERRRSFYPVITRIIASAAERQHESAGPFSV